MAWAALGLNPSYHHQNIVDDSLLIYLGEQLHNPGVACAALGLSLSYNHQSIVDDSLFIYLGEQLHNPEDGLGSSRDEP